MKRLALRLPPVKQLYLELIERNKELSLLRSGSAAHDPNHIVNRPDRGTNADLSDRFYHFDSCFNAADIIRRHAAPNLTSQAGYLTNYLGVRINVAFIPPVLANHAGEVEMAPIPANWHADMAEFAAALRSVELASEQFTVIELGCGWGCWTNITGAAARRLGKRVKLIGVEGDTGHLEFARTSFRDNSFSEDEVHLHHGIASANRGVAYFPADNRSGDDWGKSPIFVADGEKKPDPKGYVELPMISLKDIVGKEDRVDLLHIDIQGGEADLLAGCLKNISKKVAYICIGTHSREIEGKLFDLMAAGGWRLEIERPAIYQCLDGKLVLYVDGIQGWRNPALF